MRDRQFIPFVMTEQARRAARRAAAQHRHLGISQAVSAQEPGHGCIGRARRRLRQLLNSREAPGSRVRAAATAAGSTAVSPANASSSRSSARIWSSTAPRKPGSSATVRISDASIPVRARKRVRRSSSAASQASAEIAKFSGSSGEGLRDCNTDSERGFAFHQDVVGKRVRQGARSEE